MHRVIPILTCSLLALPLSAQGPAPDPLESHVRFLSSETLEGRLTGGPGAEAAAVYLAERLTELGAEPLPGEKELMLSFDFTAGSRDIGSSLVLRTQSGEQRWASDTTRVQALSFSDNATVSGPVVFAGYGISVPEGVDSGFDSYAMLDVQDKIVIVLRYVPEDIEGQTRASLARYSGLRYKAMTARENGARALIVVTGPRSAHAGEVVPMAFDTAISGSGLPAASINGELAEALFSAAGKSLEEVQESFDSGNPHVTGFDLEGVEIELTIELERERREGRNVIGVLPGGGTTDKAPYVVLGAHFDHLGRGRNGNSLARKDERDLIHYGADDNASGVAAVLEIASALTKADLRRRLVVAFWTGEELGLLGSTAFVKAGSLDAGKIAGYLNFDMVGRVKDNRLSVQATGSSELWPQLIEQSNVPVGFDLQLQDDPYLPTDSAAFNRIEVPSLNFFSGGHEDYHRPTDVADRVNFEDLGRVAQLGELVARKLANLEQPPQFVKKERKAQRGGSRDTVRAYTGTIPDYTTEADGLLLGGVMAGGPADEAGLQEGDVIIQFGEMKITNIYDYTYALDAVKVGEPLEVIFLRDGEEKKATLVPGSR